MAEEYIAYTLTSAGRDIITRIIAGLNVTFKRIALGDGFDYNTEGFSQRTCAGRGIPPRRSSSCRCRGS